MHLFRYALCLMGLAGVCVADAQIVNTRSGPIQGSTSIDPDVVAFKGIPYAAPPVGERRWRPPQPVEPWTQTRSCTDYGPVSLQRNQRRRGVQNEDCLYLNVWTKRGYETAKRPVMVWIHGGGFTQGSGNQGPAGGDALARKGVVLVTINYRLGAMGFMTHPALSAESPHNVSGNYGILDQIAALRWVRDNIAAFGGDPGNVTIFGESAGGTSVYLLTATPLAKGLFHHAILQSPWLDPIIFRELKQESDNGPAAEFDGSEQTKRLFSDELDDADEPDDTDGVLVKLRSLSSDEVLEEVRARWPIAIDGYLFPKRPSQIYADGEQNDVAAIVGTNRDEGTMFAGRVGFKTNDDFRAAVTERFGEHADKIIAFYQPDSDRQRRRVAAQLITDGWFVQPARQFARAMDRSHKDVWMYHFTRPAWGWMGAAHAAEIAYVFGKLEQPSEDDAKLSEAMMDYWVQFATTGDPNLARLPSWPRYTNATDQHQVFDIEIKSNSRLRREASDLLDSIRGVAPDVATTK